MNQTSIKIIGRTKNKNLYFCENNPLLKPAIEHFKSVRTVRIFKNICYIEHISLAYFIEILHKNKVSYSVITTLN
jgi:hypothetical protein